MDYKPGTLVLHKYCKNRGFPEWPAMVTKWKKKAQKPGQVCVKYLGLQEEFPAPMAELEVITEDIVSRLQAKARSKSVKKGKWKTKFPNAVQELERLRKEQRGGQQTEASVGTDNEIEFLGVVPTDNQSDVVKSSEAGDGAVTAGGLRKGEPEGREKRATVAGEDNVREKRGRAPGEDEGAGHTKRVKGGADSGKGQRNLSQGLDTARGSQGLAKRATGGSLTPLDKGKSERIPELVVTPEGVTLEGAPLPSTSLNETAGGAEHADSQKPEVGSQKPGVSVPGEASRADRGVGAEREAAGDGFKDPLQVPEDGRLGGEGSDRLGEDVPRGFAEGGRLTRAGLAAPAEALKGSVAVRRGAAGGAPFGGGSSAQGEELLPKKSAVGKESKRERRLRKERKERKEEELTWAAASNDSERGFAERRRKENGGDGTPKERGGKKKARRGEEKGQRTEGVEEGGAEEEKVLPVYSRRKGGGKLSKKEPSLGPIVERDGSAEGKLLTEMTGAEGAIPVEEEVTAANKEQGNTGVEAGEREKEVEEGGRTVEESTVQKEEDDRLGLAAEEGQDEGEKQSLEGEVQKVAEVNEGADPTLLTAEADLKEDVRAEVNGAEPKLRGREENGDGASPRRPDAGQIDSQANAGEGSVPSVEQEGVSAGRTEEDAGIESEKVGGKRKDVGGLQRKAPAEGAAVSPGVEQTAKAARSAEAGATEVEPPGAVKVKGKSGKKQSKKRPEGAEIGGPPVRPQTEEIASAREGGAGLEEEVGSPAGSARLGERVGDPILEDADISVEDVAARPTTRRRLKKVGEVQSPGEKGRGRPTSGEHAKGGAEGPGPSEGEAEATAETFAAERSVGDKQGRRKGGKRKDRNGQRGGKADSDAPLVLRKAELSEDVPLAVKARKKTQVDQDFAEGEEVAEDHRRRSAAAKSVTKEVGASDGPTLERGSEVGGIAPKAEQASGNPKKGGEKGLKTGGTPKQGTGEGAPDESDTRQTGSAKGKRKAKKEGGNKAAAEEQKTTANVERPARSRLGVIAFQSPKHPEAKGGKPMATRGSPEHAQETLISEGRKRSREVPESPSQVKTEGRGGAEGGEKKKGTGPERLLRLVQKAEREDQELIQKHGKDLPAARKNLPETQQKLKRAYSEADKQKNARKTIAISNKAGSPPAAKRLKTLETSGPASAPKGTPKSVSLPAKNPKSPKPSVISPKEDTDGSKSGGEAPRKKKELSKDLVGPGGKAAPLLAIFKPPKVGLQANLAHLALARLSGAKASPSAPKNSPPKKAPVPVPVLAGSNLPPGFGGPSAKPGKAPTNSSQPAPETQPGPSRPLPAAPVTSAPAPMTSSSARATSVDLPAAYAAWPTNSGVPREGPPAIGEAAGGGAPAPLAADPRFEAEVRVALDTLASFLDTLCRSKESITKLTKVALDTGRTAGAARVLGLIIERAAGEAVPSRRVDLLFLIDSITQHAFQLSLKDKGRPEREFIGAVRDSLGQLLAAVLPPNKAEAEPDNYHQCLKVLSIWMERQIFSAKLLAHFLRELKKHNEDKVKAAAAAAAAAPPPKKAKRSERSAEDVLRSMDDMLDDEYGTQVGAAGLDFLKLRDNQDEDDKYEQKDRAPTPEPPPPTRAAAEAAPSPPEGEPSKRPAELESPFAELESPFDESRDVGQALDQSREMAKQTGGAAQVGDAPSGDPWAEAGHRAYASYEGEPGGGGLYEAGSPFPPPPSSPAPPPPLSPPPPPPDNEELPPPPEGEELPPPPEISPPSSPIPPPPPPMEEVAAPPPAPNDYDPFSSLQDYNNPATSRDPPAYRAPSAGVEYQVPILEAADMLRGPGPGTQEQPPSSQGLGLHFDGPPLNGDGSGGSTGVTPFSLGAQGPLREEPRGRGQSADESVETSGSSSANGGQSSAIKQEQRRLNLLLASAEGARVGARVMVKKNPGWNIPRPEAPNRAAQSGSGVRQLAQSGAPVQGSEAPQMWAVAPPLPMQPPPQQSFQRPMQSLAQNQAPNQPPPQQNFQGVPQNQAPDQPPPLQNFQQPMQSVPQNQAPNQPPAQQSFERPMQSLAQNQAPNQRPPQQNFQQPTQRVAQNQAPNQPPPQQSFQQPMQSVAQNQALGGNGHPGNYAPARQAHEAWPPGLQPPGQMFGGQQMQASSMQFQPPPQPTRSPFTGATLAPPPPPARPPVYQYSGGPPQGEQFRGNFGGFAPAQPTMQGAGFPAQPTMQGAGFQGVHMGNPMDCQVGGMAGQGGGFHQGLIGPLLRQLAPAVRAEPMVTRPLQMMDSMPGMVMGQQQSGQTFQDEQSGQMFQGQQSGQMYQGQQSRQTYQGQQSGQMFQGQQFFGPPGSSNGYQQ